MIFSLYFPILLSLSLSFLLHAFNKHIHSFFGLATTFNTTNIATHNYILKRHHPIPSTPTTPPPVPLPPPLIDDRLMVCTESIRFESFDDRRVDHDQIDGDDDDDDNGDNNNNDGYEDDCWRRRGNTFPPPLSSLNGNGQPNFILLPVRKNGRLQLSKARINRPKILYATRQDGRLRLYLVPDQCDEEDQEECEGEEEEDLQELVAEEEETIVESKSEEEEEVVEETRCEEEEDRVREWNKFPNERFRRCHELVNHHIHGSHHHLNMYGVSIA